MGAGRWGQRAEVGAAARKRALASGADLWDLPVSLRKRRGVERGLVRGDRWARKEGGARGELGRGVGAGAGAERKREPGRGNGPRRKGREGERMGCWAAGKGSGPPGLGCLGWARKKKERKWAMGRFELVWAILIPFLSYF